MKIKKIIPFSILKKPLFIPLYLNIIPILIGLYAIFIRPKINKVFIYILILLLINVCVVIYYHHFFSIVKLFQIFFLLLFTSYISRILTEYDYLIISKIILFLSFVVTLIEIICLGPVLGYRNFFGIHLARYVGPIGEFNFNALMLSGISLIFLFFKKYIYFFLSIGLILLNASRGAFLPILLFIFFNIIYFLIRNKRFVSYILYIFFFIMLSYPFIIYFFHHFISNIELEKDIAIFSSMRYVYHVHYVDIGMNHILGVGYFNGLHYLKSNINAMGGLFIFNYLSVLEQHNMFIQIFSEFGVIGYIVFGFTFFKLLNIGISKSIYLGMLWVSFLYGFLFLNGLSEFILYLIMSFILNYSRRKYNEKSISP